MKALFLLFATVAAFSLSAQPQGHFNKHHNATSNPSPKDNYSWKMTSFQTDDNYQLCQFSYDINHRLIAYTDTVRGEYYVVDSMTYDDNGNMVRLSGWQRLNGTLQNVYYIDYTYNEAGLIASRSNYNNFNGVWELGGVYNYSYDENGKIVLTTLTMGNMVYQKIEYAYDGDKCLSELWYSYSFDAGGLLPSEKYVNTYSNGHLTLQYDSVSDDGVHWSNNGRYTYVYDNMGNCLEHHHYDKYGSEVERNVYTYNNDMPLSSTLLPWNPEINRPKVYDNVSVCTREAWYSLDIDHNLQYICDYIYNYSDINATVLTAESERIVLYPNPISNYTVLSGLSDGPAQMEIYDIAGRFVASYSIMGPTATVDISGFVSGCYVVRIKQDNLTKSMKMVVR